MSESSKPDLNDPLVRARLGVEHLQALCEHWDDDKVVIKTRLGPLVLDPDDPLARANLGVQRLKAIKI